MRGHIQLSSVVEKLTRMKAVLSALGVVALFFCIYPTNANEVETELPLNVMDLPVELRLEIFEQLHFTDLIRVSKALPDDRSLLESVFRNMLKNHAFEVMFILDYEADIRIADTQVTVIFNGTATEYFEDIFDLLQYFGHCITKLQIEDYSGNTTPQGVSLYEKLDRQISKYVSESVVEIEFQMQTQSTEFGKKSFLKEFIVPFPNCEVAKFEYGRIDAATLRQMFPAVNSLDLETTLMKNSLPNLPHLERLTIPKSWGVFGLSMFEDTIGANPQINHLSILQCRYEWSFLQTLNRIRPDIESLEISSLSLSVGDIGEPLHFANTTVLKCKAQVYAIPGVEGMLELPLEFGNLEEIEFGHPIDDDGHVVNWINILIKNKKLKKVSALHGLPRDHLEQIANELPNLEEFTMKFDDPSVISVPNIVNFLRRTEKLKEASLFDLSNDDCEELAQQLINEWTPTIDYRFCRFVRN